jgi:hypothetical protein
MATPCHTLMIPREAGIQRIKREQGNAVGRISTCFWLNSVALRGQAPWASSVAKLRGHGPWPSSVANLRSNSVAHDHWSTPVLKHPMPYAYINQSCWSDPISKEQIRQRDLGTKNRRGPVMLTSSAATVHFEPCNCVFVCTRRALPHHNYRSIG